MKEESLRHILETQNQINKRALEVLKDLQEQINSLTARINRIEHNPSLTIRPQPNSRKK